MQHTVKRGLLFEKAKQSFVNRKKLVRFDLNPLLERSDVLHHDLKELKYRGFACEEYKQSEVSCESWNPNLPRQVRKFGTGQSSAKTASKLYNVWPTNKSKK